MALITRKTTKILGFTGIFLIVAGGVAGLGVPSVNSILQQQDEISTAEAAVVELTASRDNLRGVEANYPNTRAFEQQMLTKFPQLAQTPELLNAMQVSAASAGIGPADILTMTFQAPEVQTPVVPEVPAPVADPEAAPAEGEAPAEPAPDAAAPAAEGAVDTSVASDTYARIPVEVTIRGGARELQVFLDELHNLDRAILLNGFTVANDNDDPAVKLLSFTGNTYVYSRIQTPEELLLAQQNPATGAVDPLAPAPTTPAP